MKIFFSIKNASIISFFLLLFLASRSYLTRPNHVNNASTILKNTAFNKAERSLSNPVTKVNTYANTDETLPSKVNDPLNHPAASLSHHHVIRNKKQIYNEEKMEEIAKSATLQDFSVNQQILKTY